MESGLEEGDDLGDIDWSILWFVRSEKVMCLWGVQNTPVLILDNFDEN